MVDVGSSRALTGPYDRSASPAEAKEFHIAIDRETFEDLERALSPDRGPNATVGERGAYCVITRSRGHRRVTYNVQEVVDPDDGDVTFQRGINPTDVDPHDLSHEDADDVLEQHDLGLQYSAEYRRRARQAALKTNGAAGLMICHTHPFGPARPNDIDRVAQRRNLYSAAQELPAGAPFAAALYAETGSWHARAIEMDVARTRTQSDSEAFGPHTATETPATAIRVVGPSFEKAPTTATADKMGPGGVDGEIDPELVDSSRRLWGLEGQETLAGLRVGITGCGGGGSILAELLARLGVGELVLVDFDRVEPANFNRHLGACREDVDEGRLKVDVSARVASRSATAEAFDIQPIVGSVVEADRSAYDPLGPLLDCDVIFNAADSAWARKVLDELAFAHLIPVLDGGSPLATDEEGVLTDRSYATISLSVPGGTCLECVDVWNQPAVDDAMEHVDSRRYVDERPEDGEERAPSVIQNNALVESLAMQRFVAMVMDIAPELTTGGLRYSPREAELWWRPRYDDPITECHDGCERPMPGAGEDGFRSATYRHQDPYLTEHLEDRRLPEPSLNAPNSPAPSTRSEPSSLLQRIREAIPNRG